MRDIPLRYMGLLVLIAVFAGMLISNVASAQFPNQLPEFGSAQGQDIWRELALQGNNVFLRAAGTTDCGNKTSIPVPLGDVIAGFDGNITSYMRDNGQPGTPCTDTNWVYWNLTFPGIPPSLTKVEARIICSAAEGGMKLIIANAQLTWLAASEAFTCATGASGGVVTLTGTFNDAAFIQIIIQDFSGFAARVLIQEIHAWDARSTDQTFDYPVMTAYLDAISRRAQRDSFTQSGTTFETNTSKPILFPSGKGFYYATTLSREGFGSAVGATREYNILRPTTTSSDLTFTLLMASYVNPGMSSAANPDVVYTLWEYNNVATQQRSATLKNTTMLNGQVYFFATLMFQEGGLFHSFPQCVAGDTIGGCWVRQDSSTVPFGNATCVIGVCHATRPYMLGFGYKNNSAFTGLISLGAAGWGCSGFACPMDLANATLTGAPAFVANGIAAGGEIFLSLEDTNRMKYVGNALMFVLAKISNSNLCSRDIIGSDNPNSTIKVNGQDSILAIQTNAVISGFGMVQFCGWVIDDFTKTSSINLDAFGNNRYHDNIINGSRAYNLILPPTLATNFGSDGGGLIRVVSGFLGRGSERIICHPDTAVCSGNLDTAGFAVPGAVAKVKWDWNITDEETHELINGSRIVETVSSTVGITNVNGRVIINTTNQYVQWSVTAAGYNPLAINWTFLESRSVIFMNYTLSRLGEKQFHNTSCTALIGGGLKCGGNATSDPTNSCVEVGGTDGQCNAGAHFGVGLKRIEFGCPADVSDAVTKPLQNVSIHESRSNYVDIIGATAFGLNGDLNPADCALDSTTSIQNSRQDWTFSKVGFNTIKFNADWLDKQVIRITVLFVRGDTESRAFNGEVSVSVTNGTVIDGGIGKQATFIVLKDLTTPSASIIGARGIPPIEGLVVNLGIALGFASVAGKAIWGVLFIAFILGIYAGVHFRATRTERTIGRLPSSRSITFVGAFAFFAVGYVGLFPLELIIIGILIVVITAGNAARSYF